MIYIGKYTFLFFWKFKRKAQLGTRNAFDNFLTGLNWPHLLKALEIILVKSNTIDAVFNVWCMTYVGWGHAATHTGRSGMECSWTLDTAAHESSGYPSDIPKNHQIDCIKKKIIKKMKISSCQNFLEHKCRLFCIPFLFNVPFADYFSFIPM